MDKEAKFLASRYKASEFTAGAFADLERGTPVRETAADGR